MATTSPDESTFERLFRLHHDVVLRHCARRSNPADAADAAAETFLVAWRRRHELASLDSARSWLLAVADKTLANQYRAKARRRRLTERAALFAKTRPRSDAVVAVPAFEPMLSSALARLNDTDREILAMAIFRDMPPIEIASTLGISRPAVDQRFLRAKRHLAREMGVLAETSGLGPADRSPS